MHSRSKVRNWPVMHAAVRPAASADALLPTMGGQTALNTALALDKDGTLTKFGVEMIGARPASIEKAEDRELFRVAMEKIGLQCARARTVNRGASRASTTARGGWSHVACGPRTSCTTHRRA